MNIFFTDECPVRCAKNLDTKRVIKMNLETAQMLCTALFLNAPELFTVVEFCNLKTRKVKKAYYIDGVRMCAPTHINHPSNVWIRKTNNNYIWGLSHFKALAKEFYDRRGKWHKTYKEVYEVLNKYKHKIKSGPLTSFANCAANDSVGVNFKHLEDTVEAYKRYLSVRWERDKIEPTWQ